MEKRANELELYDRVDIGNGLKYEVESLSEAQNGKIKVVLFPYQNSMSARKRVSLPENKMVQLV